MQVKLVNSPPYIYCDRCESRVCDGVSYGVQSRGSPGFSCRDCAKNINVTMTINTINEIKNFGGKTKKTSLDDEIL